MLHWLISWWRAGKRRTDLNILWPICKEQAQNLDHAKAAFAVHAFNDPAWLCLGHDAIVAYISGME